MTIPVDPSLMDALAPVRQALMAAASADADQVRASSEAQAREILATADAEAARILEAAQQAGIADADVAVAAEQTTARRRARGQLLQARLVAYRRLRAQSRAAVAALRDQPDYRDLQAALTRAARHLLGPSAEVRGPSDGGIIGELADRRIDLSLTGLADRAVDAVAVGLDRT